MLVLTLKGQVWCSQTHRDRADGGGVREDNSCRSEKLGFAASYFVNLGRLESAEFPNRIAVDELDCRPNYSCTISAIPEPFAPHVGARHVLARSHSQGVTRDRQARVAGLQGCRLGEKVCFACAEEEAARNSGHALAILLCASRVGELRLLQLIPDAGASAPSRSKRKKQSPYP